MHLPMLSPALSPHDIQRLPYSCIESSHVLRITYCNRTLVTTVRFEVSTLLANIFSTFRLCTKLLLMNLSNADADCFDQTLTSPAVIDAMESDIPKTTAPKEAVAISTFAQNNQLFTYQIATACNDLQGHSFPCARGRGPHSPDVAHTQVTCSCATTTRRTRLASLAHPSSIAHVVHTNESP